MCLSVINGVHADLIFCMMHNYGQIFVLYYRVASVADFDWGYYTTVYFIEIQ